MEYLGHTVNFRTSKPSYKSKRIVANPEEKWAVFENTHEALISQEQWDIVQKNRQQRRRPTRMGDLGMFSGLLFCADCGSRLHLCRTKSWARSQDNYVCSVYRRGKGECTAHYIRAIVVEQLVLDDLREIIASAREDEAEFVRRAMENKMAAQLSEQTEAKRQYEQQMRRMTEIDAIIKHLYEDSITGKLTEERFSKLAADYEQEQETLRESTDELRQLVEESQTQSMNMDGFLKLVRKYTVPDKLFPELVNAFVEKILVHAPEKINGERRQKIDIHYNFIGEIDRPNTADNGETA